MSVQSMYRGSHMSAHVSLYRGPHMSAHVSLNSLNE